MRHRVLPAEPRPVRGGPPRLGHGSLAGHGEGRRPQRRGAGAGHRRQGRRCRGHPVRRRHVRSGRRPRGAAPHSRRRAVAARGGARAQARRPFRLRRRADHQGQRLRAQPVDPDLARGHHRHQAARPRGLASSAGGAGRVLPRGSPRGDRRPAHVRAERAGADGRQRGRGRRPNRQRGVHRGDARLAGPDLRGVGAARSVGLGLGEVRLQRLDVAELGRRQRVAARRTQGLVLQRDGHRRETATSPHDPADPSGS